MDKIKNNEIQLEIEKESIMLPVVALRGKVFFPNTMLNFDAGRPMSVKALKTAVSGEGLIFITSQNNALIDNPTKNDLCLTGVVSKITSKAIVSDGVMKASVKALYRAKIVEFCDTKDYFSAKVKEEPYIPCEDNELLEAHYRLAKKSFFEYSLSERRISKEIVTTLSMIKDTNEFIDNAMSVVNFKESETQKILIVSDSIERLVAFKELFDKENAILKLEKQIANKVKSNMEKTQKEFYLREQIKAIHEELGDDVDEIEKLRNKVLEKKLPKQVEEKALKELTRLEKINPSSPDYSIILNYIDWILELPFNEQTKDTERLQDAKEVLDGDHFGLDKVKQRIVEYLAVLQLTKEIRGPILCFVGPPGVGKTSVATSIARALNRKFVRMSLGGVKDEAEIRGHRKTYVGAMPGRIAFGLKTAGSNNPVFLLDEIDKLSSDIHGDPASALLEVLDPEQNSTFRDRYLEIPYDLSKVMFITTANSIDTIPVPLLDRMEVIELSGYTTEEKLEIAKRYLIPKAINQNGISDKKIQITDEAIKEIISSYTMEAGVRNLEREIGSVVRKVAVMIAENPKTRKQVIKESDVAKFLGIKKHVKDEVLESDEVGACNGLAWTAYGGTTLTIEVGLMKGKGEILLTGKLGDVMKESARAALSYIKANAKKYNIAEEVFDERDIHIHVPEGATPKDGPSAGITMATAILSAFTKKPVKKSVAMTGEITLRGKVLPIGGLKEKSLAAYRQGIKTIIIPKANQKDLEEIPSEIKKDIKFILADNVEKVFDNAIKF